MNFDLSEEQQLIQDSVSRFINDNYSLEQREVLVKSKAGFSSEHWQQMAELGWLGLPFSEDQGGFGGNQVDTMIVMEQFGKGLVCEPYLSAIVLGGGALKYATNQQLAAEWLPSVIEGSKRLALAYAEVQSRFDLNDVATHARPEGDDYVVNGQKSMIQNGEGADAYVVSVRLSGSHADSTGIGLLLIPADADGLKANHFPTVDGLRATELEFKDVRVPMSQLLVSGDRGFQMLTKIAADGILALSAEAVGAMEMLYKDTVAYTQEREQFGHPLADFQALQHRMVDMFMEYEQCKSLLYRATLEIAEDNEDAARTVHALKYLIGKTAIFIGESAVQLHGGMGVTEELRVGHYFKRLLVLDAQFGNSDHHLQQFAA
ncbi:MAG: acyl-CoA dehydrogenase family protein [Pseudomonadota bacterium]